MRARVCLGQRLGGAENGRPANANPPADLEKHIVYVDRSKTNRWILAEATRRVNLGRKPGALRKQVGAFSERWKRGGTTMQRHVLRAHPDDPVRALAFHEGTAEPLLPARRRPGRPRNNWTTGTMHMVWTRFALERPLELGIEFDPCNRRHTDWILELAVQRRF